MIEWKTQNSRDKLRTSLEILLTLNPRRLGQLSGTGIFSRKNFLLNNYSQKNRLSFKYRKYTRMLHSECDNRHVYINNWRVIVFYLLSSFTCCTKINRVIRSFNMLRFNKFMNRSQLTFACLNFYMYHLPSPQILFLNYNCIS